MANYVTDTFTDTDTTALSAHTPDVGGTWTPYSHEAVIMSNAATPLVFSNCAAFNSTTPATDDYQVSADLSLTLPSSGNGGGVRIRDTGEFAAYVASFEISAGQWQLTYGFATLGTYVDSGFVDGTTRHVILSAVGTTINVNINGVDRITVTDSSGSTGLGGFEIAGGSTTGCNLDNFSVDDVVSGPPAGTHIVTGRDNFTLDITTTFLSTTITGRTVNMTAGQAEPPNYFHVGMISWGTVAHGAMKAYPVTRDLDLVEIPAGCDKLWFEFGPGVEATIVELTAP